MNAQTELMRLDELQAAAIEQYRLTVQAGAHMEKRLADEKHQRDIEFFAARLRDIGVQAPDGATEATVGPLTLRLSDRDVQNLVASWQCPKCSAAYPSVYEVVHYLSDIGRAIDYVESHVCWPDDVPAVPAVQPAPTTEERLLSALRDLIYDMIVREQEP